MKTCHNMLRKKELAPHLTLVFTNISKIRLYEVRWDFVLQFNRPSDLFFEPPQHVQPGLYEDDQLD